MKRKQLALRVLSTAALMAMVSSIAAAAFADTYYVDYGDIKVDGSKVNYYNASGVSQTNPDDKDIVITNNNKVKSTSNTVTINASEGSTADVTLKDVNINTSGYDKAAVTVTGNGTTSIELDGKNTLTSGGVHAGLEKNDKDGKGNLVIKDDTKDGGSLKATGSTRDGSYKNGSAGIGGGDGESTSNITITGGTITATSKNNGAGIGSGYGGEGTNINITGGAITATSEKQGAGIGGGYMGNGTNITITGGTITATSEKDGAGIGGGYSGGGYMGNGTNITITGGTVTATSENDGAGIGGGCNGLGTSSKGTNITITGGTVTANSKGGGAGIGGGYYSEGTDIKITGGTVTANGEDGGAGIGGGYAGEGTNIKITGGTVTANSGEKGAGIGGGHRGSGTDITIAGGTVTANGGEKGAGIGGGSNGSGTDIKITGGTVTANGGKEGAGIGGGQSGFCWNITVSGNASVTVRGGNSGVGYGTGAGIGDGGNTVNGDEVLPNYTGMNKGHITYLDQADGHKVKILHNRPVCVWDEGEIIKEPTETENGLRLHHCILEAEADCSDPACNDTWLEVLPKLASQLREVGVIFWDAANNAAAPEYLQGKTLNVEETSGAVSKAQADSVLADKEHWALAEDVGDLEIHPAADAAGTVYEQAVKASGFQYYVVANVTAQ